MKQKYFLFMAMLVLAIFAVGSVSASDDIATDIDVPTDDIAVDDVTVDDVVEIDDASSDEDVDDNSGNLRTSPYTVYENTPLSDIQTTINNAESGSTIYFSQGHYNQTTLTLKSNLNVIGLNATLVGDGVNNVFNLPDNCTNIVISGFTIDANYTSSTHNISAIRGSFISNAQITNNTIYNGYNGINLNKKCANIQVTDNTISNMINDGVSFANPMTFTTISDVGYSYISRNTISNCGYGIFIGGNFNGEIKDNKISNCDIGMEFAGKPKPAAGNGTLIATLYNNTISSCDYGINMFHPNVQYLYLDLMVFNSIGEYDIFTKSPFGTYTYIGVYNSIFDAGVTQAFFNAVGSNKGNNTRVCPIINFC